MTIIDVLGREKNVTKIYDDGSYDCPFCHYPAVASAGPDCLNPGCPASRHALDNPDCADLFRKRIKDAEKRAEEEAERKRIFEWSRKRAEEESKQRERAVTAAIEEAKRRGCCIECLWPRGGWGSGKPKFIKHRKPCPRMR